MLSHDDLPSAKEPASGSSSLWMSTTLRDWMAGSYSIWFLLAGFFAILLGVAFVVGFMRVETARKDLLAADKTSVNLTALVVQHYERAAVGILQSYANRRLFIDSVKKRDTSSAHRHLAELTQNPEIDLTFVADQHGVRWANYPVFSKSIGSDLSYRDWYRAVSSNRQPYISSAFEGTTGDQSLAVAICVPIFDEEGRTIGILGTAQRFGILSKTIKQVPLSPYTGVTLIDRDGQILYSNRYSYEKEIMKHPDLPIIEKALLAKRQQVEWFDPRNREKRYLTAASVEGIGWTVIVERGWKGIIRAQSKEMIMAGVFAIMMFLLASALLLYFRKVARAQKAKELMHAELRFKSLFESMNSGVAVYRAEGDAEDFIIIDLNQAGQRIAGVDEDVIGKRVTEVFPGVRDFGLIEVFQRVWRTGKAEDHQSSAYQDDRLTFWADNYVYKLPSGEIVAIFDDITARVRAEEALRESEENYRRLASSSDSMYLVDRECRYQFMNEMHLSRLGMTLDEVEGRLYGEIHSTEETELFTRDVERVFETGKAVQSEHFSVRDNRWFLRTFSPVKESDGGVSAVTVVSKDVTERKRAEEELRANRMQLSNALEMAHLGHWEYDVADDLFTFNDHFYKIFHTTVKEVGGYTMRSAEYARRFIHPEDIAVVGEETREAIETKDPRFNRQIEHRMLYADGTIGYISVRFFIVKDAQGATIKTYGVNQDITERKRAEEALRESEELYRTFINATSDMAFVKDDQFRHVIANDHLATFFGRAPEDVIGKTDFELMPEAAAQSCRTSDEEAIRTKSVIVTEETIAGRIYETTKFPVALRDGQTGVGGIIKDVTERKKAEAAMQELQRQQAALLHNIPDMAWLKDRESRFIAVNEPFAESCGFEVDELVGKSDLDIRPRELAERYRADDREVMESGLQKRVEELLKDGEGQELWIETIKTPIYDDQGEVIGTVGIARDITEKKMSFDRLRKALGATVQAMAVAVEVRDPYTAGHQKRVADLARAIATEMGLTPHQIDGVRMAGLIHDIGKMSVPAEILSKPTKLSDIEFGLIQTHVQAGYDILKDIEFPWPIARMVLEHHERMNGSGYPNGLTSDKLLIESQVLMVADVVEAMASHRPYRPSVGLSEALDEIAKNRGVLYDSDAVEACLRLFREKGYQLV